MRTTQGIITITTDYCNSIEELSVLLFTVVDGKVYNIHGYYIEPPNMTISKFKAYCCKQIKHKASKYEEVYSNMMQEICNADTVLFETKACLNAFKDFCNNNEWTRFNRKNDIIQFNYNYYYNYTVFNIPVKKTYIEMVCRNLYGLKHKEEISDVLINSTMNLFTLLVLRYKISFDIFYSLCIDNDYIDNREEELLCPTMRNLRVVEQM